MDDIPELKIGDMILFKNKENKSKITKIYNINNDGKVKIQCFDKSIEEKDWSRKRFYPMYIDTTNGTINPRTDLQGSYVRVHPGTQTGAPFLKISSKP